VLDGEIAGVHVVVGALQLDQPAQLDERFRVVVDAQVEEAPRPRLAARLAGDDEDGRRLAPADVTALRLGGVERGQHALGQVALGVAVGLGHRRPDGRLLHHVGLHREALAGLVAGGGDARLAGVRRHLAGRVDERHLPHVAPASAATRPSSASWPPCRRA
jgi:hypothetical protein